MSWSGRKYLKTALMEAGGHFTDQPAMMALHYLLRLLRVVMLLALWRLILNRPGAHAAMPMGRVLSYTLLAAMFEDQLECRTRLGDTFWNGQLLSYLIRPLNLFSQFAAETIGSWLPGLGLFSLPLFILAPMLGVSPWPAHPGAAAWFLLSLLLAIAVGLAWDFVFWALVLYLDNSIYPVIQIRLALSLLLSGALIPLTLLPWGLGDIFAWLPFAAMAWAPLSIYTGAGHPLSMLVMQTAWALLLWPLAVWLWRSGQERMVSHGG